MTINLWLLFLVAFIIQCILHELGHILSALYFKVPINFVTLGLWKPYLKFKLFGLECRVTPWLVGAGVDLKGEDNKEEGLLSKPDWQINIIILSGLFINLLLVILLTWILKLGVRFSPFIVDYTYVLNNHYLTMFLFYSWILNVGILITNALPLPPLDGGMIWLIALAKRNEFFYKYFSLIRSIGFTLIILLNILAVYYLYK